jgi:class 3 adenylate cyclase
MKALVTMRGALGDPDLGDGVNIAARLEGIAKPGAICLASQIAAASTGSFLLRRT